MRHELSQANGGPCIHDRVPKFTWILEPQGAHIYRVWKFYDTGSLPLPNLVHKYHVEIHTFIWAPERNNPVGTILALFHTTKFILSSAWHEEQTQGRPNLNLFFWKRNGKQSYLFVHLLHMYSC